MAGYDSNSRRAFCFRRPQLVCEIGFQKKPSKKICGRFPTKIKFAISVGHAGAQASLLRGGTGHALGGSLGAAAHRRRTAAASPLTATPCSVFRWSQLRLLLVPGWAL
jgi:hypothetical protein